MKKMKIKMKRVKPRDPHAKALADMGVKSKVRPNHKPRTPPTVGDWD